LHRDDELELAVAFPCWGRPDEAMLLAPRARVVVCRCGRRRNCYFARSVGPLGIGANPSGLSRHSPWFLLPTPSARPDNVRSLGGI